MAPSLAGVSCSLRRFSKTRDCGASSDSDEGSRPQPSGQPRDKAYSSTAQSIPSIVQRAVATQRADAGPPRMRTRRTWWRLAHAI